MEIEYLNVSLKIGKRSTNNISNDILGVRDCNVYKDDAITVITSREINNIDKNTRTIKVEDNFDIEDLLKSLECLPQWIYLDIEDGTLSTTFDYLLDFIKANKKIKFKIYINSIAKTCENIEKEISRTNFMQFIENALVISFCNIDKRDMIHYIKQIINYEIDYTSFKYLIYFKDTEIIGFNKHAFYDESIFLSDMKR